MIHRIILKDKGIILEFWNTFEKSIFTNDRVRLGKVNYLIKKVKIAKRKQLIEYFVEKERDLWSQEEII